jgi:hypothetical protein
MEHRDDTAGRICSQLSKFFARGSVLKLIVRQLFQLTVCRGVSKIDNLVMCMVSINCSRRLIVMTVRMLSLIELWLYEKVITYFVSLFLLLCLSLTLQFLLSFRQPAYTSIDIMCSGALRCCEYAQMEVDTGIKETLEECLLCFNGSVLFPIWSTAEGCL